MRFQIVNRYALILFLLGSSPRIVLAQAPLTYRVQYFTPGDCCIRVQINFTDALKTPVALVMPRAYPGGYQQILYDTYVENVAAFDVSGKALAMVRAKDGPRWNVGSPGETVSRIEYSVDVTRMETQLLSSDQTSKVRRGYVGLLGYSALAFVEGFEGCPVQLVVNGPAGWPVLSTLAPHVPAEVANTTVSAPDYYALADSQILMGPELQLRRFEGKIPLVLAMYSEAATNADAQGDLAHRALDAVQAYFGDTPIRQYTVQLEFFKPVAGHQYDFSQEHVDSGTFSFSTGWRLDAPFTGKPEALMLGNYAHHIAHSWIPKRAYGVGYRPFTWELTPVIDTIWFNEGFGRYASIEAVVAQLPPAEAAKFRDAELSWMRQILDDAPPFIKKMSLETLSREASFLYAVDFRLGKNIFSRGALMAAEMDDRIRTKTSGQKSLRDAIRALLAWSDKNHCAFQVEEMMRIFQDSTGVDLRDILKRWQQPLNH